MKYRYSGPLSGVTLDNGDEVMLHPGAEVDLPATRRAERPPGAFRLPRHRFAATRAVYDARLFAHACLTDCRT